MVQICCISDGFVVEEFETYNEALAFIDALSDDEDWDAYDNYFIRRK